MFEEIFKYKKIVPQKLSDFGFLLQADGKTWLYKTDILEGTFCLTLSLCEQKSNLKIQTNVVEKSTSEEYILYKTQAQGSFIAEIRGAIEAELLRVSENCCIKSIFKSEQAARTIEYVRKTYGDELEFLWKKFDNNAIWRRKDTQKWYAAVLTVEAKKLGLNESGTIEIIDLRTLPAELPNLLKKDGYFPGWHMNKKHWFSIVFDFGMSDTELFQRIDQSYSLALG